MTAKGHQLPIVRAVRAKAAGPEAWIDICTKEIHADRAEPIGAKKA